MAEIKGREAVPGKHRLPATAGPPAPGANGRPGDPDALRHEIAMTRARMTRTLDQIEGRLARQKEELVARATLRDLRRSLGREPWRTLAIAFVAGYVVAAIRD